MLQPFESGEREMREQTRRVSPHLLQQVDERIGDFALIENRRSPKFRVTDESWPTVSIVLIRILNDRIAP